MIGRMLDLGHLFATGGLLMTIIIVVLRGIKGIIRSDLYFSFFLFFLFLVYLDECLAIIGIDFDYVFGQLLFYNVSFFLIAPMFYLSVKHFVNPKYRIHPRHILHLTPFFLSTFLMTLVFLLYNFEGGSLRFLLWEELISFFIIVLLVSQIIGYLWGSYRTIKQYQMNTNVYFSSAEGIDVSWLKNLIYVLIFLIMIWLLQVPFPGLTSITNVGYFFVVFYISYSVIIQKDIFPFTEQEALEVFEVIDDKKAGSLSSIGSEHVVSEKRRLTELMERERPYLDNELSLPKLARLFQTSSHQLSFLINSGFRENFYDYVNRHRVNESMRLLVDKKLFHLSMVGIALESGFNSKTAFNTAFKKFTGTTPTEFRKMQLRKGTCDV